MDYSIKTVKSNSNASKKEQEPVKVEQVVTGNVIAKKRSLGRKFADVFIKEDINDVKSYVFSEILIPRILSTVYDVASTTLGMILGVDVKRSSGTFKSTSSVRYDGFYGKSSTSNSSVKRAPSFEVMDIVIPFDIEDEKGRDARTIAEDTITTLLELIDVHGHARVADFYEMVSVPSQWTDNNYGWKNLGTARSERVVDGYLIKLPKPIPLNNG